MSQSQAADSEASFRTEQAVETLAHNKRWEDLSPSKQERLHDWHLKKTAQEKRHAAAQDLDDLSAQSIITTASKLPEAPVKRTAEDVLQLLMENQAYRTQYENYLKKLGKWDDLEKLDRMAESYQDNSRDKGKEPMHATPSIGDGQISKMQEDLEDALRQRNEFVMSAMEMDHKVHHLSACIQTALSMETNGQIPRPGEDEFGDGDEFDDSVSRFTPYQN